ncbi:MAG: trigger factor, partial [Chloroflexaceae bacterium]|nr:trigger factor [Chloroflexaceae bacterium]
MKITTERLPKSLIALDVELEPAQVEKGLDRAARRISEKHNIPGFRKGKAPRFIIENYFGREALIEEATDDLINKAYRAALEQEQIEPVGQGQIEAIDVNEGFRFRITVPVYPTFTLPDYRTIRIPLHVEAVTDEIVGLALNSVRDRHVVLRELEEPRPAQQGDQLTVRLETLVDGERVEDFGEADEIPETTLVLDPDYVIEPLYQGLLSAQLEETREIPAHIPADHEDERVRDKDVVFKVHVTAMQERLLPEWDEVPTLEEFEGTLEEFRDHTRTDLEQRAQQRAEQDVLNRFIAQVVEQTEYDLPDVMIAEVADDLLNEQGAQFARYGISLDQMLQFRNQTREDARAEFLGEAEQRLKTRLALGQVVEREMLMIDPNEVQSAAQAMLASYAQEELPAVMQALSNPQTQEQFMYNVANSVLDTKLRARLLAIAVGEAPEPGSDHDHAAHRPRPRPRRRTYRRPRPSA